MSRRWPIPLALALALVAGCSREDVPRLARVGRKAAARFEGLAGGAHGRLITEVRQAVPVEGGPGLAQRVGQRLRWDRDLTGADLRVSSPSPGVIHLEGTVRGLDQRRRALDLSRSTLGVDHVVDRMTVGRAGP
jgi:hypothetical protein